ncbi:MAG TPA: hypothetical protein VEK11_04655 [Thermoanaerobaculia bacterium]|nr:hypothetical protein [Thermoanaerobaculia bacterium]
MPKWAKVLLVVMACGFFLVVGVVLVAVRWVKSNAGEWREQGKAVQAEAVAFGQGKDANACVDEAFARLDRCESLMCEAQSKLFLSSCLRTASKPPDFCQGVPKRDEILAGAKWTIAECARRGFSDNQRCHRVISAIQEVCAPTSNL